MADFGAQQSDDGDGGVNPGANLQAGTQGQSPIQGQQAQIQEGQTAQEPQTHAPQVEVQAMDDKKPAKDNLAEINRDFQEQEAKRKAHEMGLPYIDLGKTPINPDFMKTVEIEAVRRARAIVFLKMGNRLRLAVSDQNRPETQALISQLKNQGYEVDLAIASDAGIDDAIKIFESTQKYKELDIVESVEEKSIETYEKEIAGMSDLAKKLESVTAEEGLNMLNIAAMKTGSSDMHFEPTEGEVIVRLRIDGMLHEVFRLKQGVYKNIANQIKYEGGMQLNQATVPQDGRYTFNFNDQKIGVRVASIPTPYGESFVSRFLVGGGQALSFEELGFQGISLKKMEKVTQLSQGMVLVTGPTGSGKSTTLYASLEAMNTPENKMITLEDPVEYPLQGVTQSQINEKKGYTFASGLKAILRSDPDIVMIGEIRDLETAETAIQAALTGHVLLSTLHTNSAIESIPRLINMGLPPFMVAPALNTLVAQRLVRKVCPKCHTKEAINQSEKEEFSQIFTHLNTVHPALKLQVPVEIPKVHGCEVCSNTGYKGRMVVDEVITVSSAMKDLILNNASSVKLIEAARQEGMITMREDGFMKVAQGMTTLEEVYRVTNMVI